MFKLYIECPQADCFGEREFRGIIRKLSINIGAHQAEASNREFKEMSPQADLCG